jgi:hypothetical protein
VNLLNHINQIANYFVSTYNHVLTPKIPCVFLTKLCSFHSMDLGYYNIQTSKFFFWVFFTVNFFSPKLMKIRWSSLFWVFCFFQIKLGTHSSNLNSKFVIMSEPKFFLLMGVLTQNFNTMDFVQFLEKNQKLYM